jgi:pyruvate kinase
VLGDGNIVLEIVSKHDSELSCKTIAGGLVRSKWGLNFPDSELELGAITPKDRDDIRFGLLLGVDVMALSFVNSAADITEARSLMTGHDPAPLIIAKIERRQAVEHIAEILDASDGLMVARGDLGIDLPMEKIPTVQKLLISLCRKNNKAVITATQMLESMTTSPRPTRAEVTDVANAVYDGTDAVMLSGETAVGANPPLVVETMANILHEAEAHSHPVSPPHLEDSIEEAMVEAAAVLVRDLGANAVLVPYTSGTTAGRISRQRLGVPIIAGAVSAASARRMRLFSGIFPFIVPSQTSWLANATEALNFAKVEGWIKDGDTTVATGGFPLGRVGTTNFVRAFKVGDDL